MKTITAAAAALVVIALALGLGMLQRRTLERLDAEAAVLEAENAILAAEPPVPSADPAASPRPSAEASDPAAAAALFLDRAAAILASAERPSPDDALALMDALSGTAPGTLHAILDAIGRRGFPADIEVAVASMALIELARHDPEAAAEKTLTDPRLLEILAPVLDRWASADPAAAHAWLDAAKASGRFADSDPRWIERASETVAGALVNRDPSKALAHAASLDGQERHDYLRAAALNVATPGAWLDFARSAAALNDPELRRASLLELANSTLHNDGLDDIRDVVDQLDLPPRDLNLFIRAAAIRTIDADTPARAEWMIERSDPARLEANLKALVGIWTMNDFNAAATWLRSLPDSPVRDAAVAEFAVTAVEREPASAVDWALTISDRAAQRAALDAVVAHWQDRDPDAARRYLENLGAGAAE